MKTALVQVGVMGLRAPNGEFLEAVPIYKELPGGEQAEPSKGEIDLAKLLAEKYKRYIDGLSSLGIEEDTL